MAFSLSLNLSFILMVSVILTLFIALSSQFLIKTFMDGEVIIKDGSMMLRTQVVTRYDSAFLNYVPGRRKSCNGIHPLNQHTGGDILHRTCRGGYMGIVWAQAVSDMITALVALILLFRLVLYNDIRMC